MLIEPGDLRSKLSVYYQVGLEKLCIGSFICIMEILSELPPSSSNLLSSLLKSMGNQNQPLPYSCDALLTQLNHMLGQPKTPPNLHLCPRSLCARTYHCTECLTRWWYTESIFN